MHVLAREDILRGPLPRASCERLEEWGAPLADAMPRTPTPAALEAAREGIARFAALGEEQRHELSGSLPWLLFSPTTREGATNPIFAQVEAFAAGSLNPATGRAYPYRCWHGLTQVLVAGGAKHCPTTSAQCESLFTGLTRQQGASKLHMSQQQIAFEARCRKNPTMESLSVPMLSNGWAEAKAVQHMLDTKGFWSCDVTLAANRKFGQKLKEQVEERLEFYDKGTAPRKNIAMMQAALEAAGPEFAAANAGGKKRKASSGGDEQTPKKQKKDKSEKKDKSAKKEKKEKSEKKEKK